MLRQELPFEIDRNIFRILRKTRQKFLGNIPIFAGHFCYESVFNIIEISLVSFGLHFLQISIKGQGTQVLVLFGKKIV